MSDTQPPSDALPEPPPPLNPMPTYLRRLLVAALAGIVAAAAGLILWLDDDPTNDDPTSTTAPSTGTTETTLGPTTTDTTEPTTTSSSTTSSSTTTTTGNPITVPAACRPAAENNGTELRTDFPTDATTGPELNGHDEDRLKVSGKPSTWTITAANTVVDGVFHHGRIEVSAPGVTIKNSVICGVGALIVRSNSTGLVIENSILAGEKGRSNGSDTGQPCEAAVGYGTYTLLRSEVFGCADGLKVANSVTVRDSYFHDNYANRLGSGAGTHNDTVQQANSPLNTFNFTGNSAYQDECTSNRHFQMAPTANPGGTVGTWRIDGNFFYGIRLINVDRGVRVADGLMRDNVLAGTATRGPFPHPLYAGDGMGTITRSGNTYEDGAPANNNYVESSYTCVGG